MLWAFSANTAAARPDSRVANPRTAPHASADLPTSDLPLSPTSGNSPSETEGPVAFEARLTPQPQPESVAANPAGGSVAPRGPLETPVARLASLPEPSANPSRQVDDDSLAADNRLAGTNRKPHAASDNAANLSAHGDLGRKPLPEAVTASPAQVSDPQPVAGARGAVEQPLAGAHQADSAAPQAPEAATPTTETNPVPDPPKAPSAARDMRFEVGGGDQKVEIRVAERGGEVHVAVRTPDDRMAGALRDGLPSLAARLESAGLRTETWHGGSAGNSGRERLGETYRTPSQNSQDQPAKDGRRQQDDPPPQRPRRAADPAHPERDRKDFQWHFTSLQ